MSRRQNKKSAQAAPTAQTPYVTTRDGKVIRVIVRSTDDIANLHAVSLGDLMRSFTTALCAAAQSVGLSEAVVHQIIDEDAVRFHADDGYVEVYLPTAVLNGTEGWAR